MLQVPCFMTQNDYVVCHLMQVLENPMQNDQKHLENVGRESSPSTELRRFLCWAVPAAQGNRLVSVVVAGTE